MRNLIVSILTLSFLLTACGEDVMQSTKSPFMSINDVPESAWQRLASKRIYFGHQSVGKNIITGIEDIVKENPKINLHIIETTDLNSFDTPVFAHSRVGKNLDPKSKCDAFTELMDKGIGQQTQVAFLKFCYVDISESTDIDQVFNMYKRMMADLKSRFLTTTFVHITLPLTTIQTGIKTKIKMIIGREIEGLQDNIKREQFNQKLREEFKDKDPIFDLATLESTFPDGSRATFTYDGKTYYRLIPEYAYDEGHLNEFGRKIIAEQLLIFLANLPG